MLGTFSYDPHLPLLCHHLWLLTLPPLTDWSFPLLWTLSTRPPPCCPPCLLWTSKWHWIGTRPSSTQPGPRGIPWYILSGSLVSHPKMYLCIKCSTKLRHFSSVVSFLLLIPSSVCSWLPIQPGASPTGAWRQPNYRQGLLEHLTHQPRQLQCPAGGAGHLLWSQCEHVSTTSVS